MLIKFIQDNYKTVLKFCEQQYPDYPEICDRITRILAIYLKSKNHMKQIYMCCGNYKMRYHWWLEINNKIIDITKFQFNCTDDEFNNRKFNLDFKIIADDVNNYDLRFKIKTKFCGKFFSRYKQLIKVANKSKSLDEYLNFIKLNDGIEFK